MVRRLPEASTVLGCVDDGISQVIDGASQAVKIRTGVDEMKPWTVDEVPLGSLIREAFDHNKRGLIIGAAFDMDMTYIYVGFSATHACDALTASKIYEYSTDGGRTWLPCGTKE